MRPRMGVQTGVPAEGPKARGGFPSPPLVASRTLAKQAAAGNPPHRLGSLFTGVAAAGGGRSEVKRRRAAASHGEPRTESPSEAAEPISVLGPGRIRGVRQGSGAGDRAPGGRAHPGKLVVPSVNQRLGEE